MPVLVALILAVAVVVGAILLGQAPYILRVGSEYRYLTRLGAEMTWREKLREAMDTVELDILAEEGAGWEDGVDYTAWEGATRPCPCEHQSPALGIGYWAGEGQYFRGHQAGSVSLLRTAYIRSFGGDSLLESLLQPTPSYCIQASPSGLPFAYGDPFLHPAYIRSN